MHNDEIAAARARYIYLDTPVNILDASDRFLS